MIRWLVRKILGETKKEIKKSLLKSSTTRTVAVSSISTVAIVRGIIAFLVEIGLIPEGVQEEVSLTVIAVLIPLISRLLAYVKQKVQDN